MHQAIESSVIASYDVNGSNLLITFKNGKTYQYAGAASHFKDLGAADSAGKYFCANIRGKYETAQI